MLIRDAGDHWTAITQPAHAFLAGQIVRHWSPAPGVDVVLGVEQHDGPWWEYDRHPPLHAQAGRAASFYEAPMADRLALWSAPASHLVAQSPYAALLVSLHARNIHTRYLAPEHQPTELLAAIAAEQADLLRRLPDATADQAERDADLLFAVDALSLTLCNHWDGRKLPPVDGTPTRVEALDAGVATLDPWPLSVDELTVSLDSRTLTERFADAAAMRAALASTPYLRESWTLRPA